MSMELSIDRAVSEGASESPAVLQVVGGQPVAYPIPFPQPILQVAALFRARISIGQRIYEKNAIQSQSGMFYELDRTLKNAIYGKVVLGYVIAPNPQNDGSFLQTGGRVAIKVISKERYIAVRHQTQEHPDKEMAVLNYLKDTALPHGSSLSATIGAPAVTAPPPPNHHSNICNVVECAHDAAYLFSIMEFIDGKELYDYMDEHGPLAEPEARGFFLQILSGLHVLHSYGIAHRDMSLENLMITENGRIVIIDFGMAIRVHQMSTGEHYLVPNMGHCGKKNYISPEVLSNAAFYNPALCDMWAMGVILFMLLTGIPPVESATPLDPRYRKIANGGMASMLAHWGIDLSREAVDLMTQMLKPNPIDRLTTSQILMHPWIRIGASDLSPPPPPPPPPTS